MPRKFRMFRAAVLAMQLITVAIRLHDAVTVHGQCERNDMVGLVSNLSTHAPVAPYEDAHNVYYVK